MKNIFLRAAFCFCLSVLPAQEGIRMEPLARLDDLTFEVYFQSIMPNAIYVDEPRLSIVISGVPRWGKEITYRESGDGSPGSWESSRHFGDELLMGQQFFLGPWCIIGDYNGILVIDGEGRNYDTTPEQDEKSRGVIDFILKNGDGMNYTIFYTHSGTGTPIAISTAEPGRRYRGEEIPRLLQRLDTVKYEESFRRAQYLGLGTQFLSGTVLVWGRMNYTQSRLPSSFWWSENHRYPTGNTTQRDLNGFLYAISDVEINGPVGQHVYLGIYDGDNNTVVESLISPWSTVLRTEDPSQMEYYYYVGYGGNIYFYFAGPEYTEVFRIRRTWGEPNLYALAVNGYTDDEYGAYVRRVLSGMNAADLALLRNHLFALEGLPFNRPEYRAYFDRQVWYSPRDITQGDIRLLDIRQALLELILREEQLRRDQASGQAAPRTSR